MVLFDHCLATKRQWSWDHATRLHAVHFDMITPNNFNGYILIFIQAFGVFGLCQIHAFVDYIRSKLSREQFELLFRTLAIVVAVTSVVVFGTLTVLGSILLHHYTPPL